MKTKILVVLLFAVLAAAQTNNPPSAGQTTDSPAAKQLDAWLTAFNSGDQAVMVKYEQDYYQDAVQRIDRLMAMRGQTGGFDLRKREDSTPTTATVLVQEHDTDDFIRMVMEVEPDPPHRVKKLTLTFVARPPEFAIARLTSSELIKALRTKLEKDSAAGQFSGAVMLVHNGKTEFSGAYGLADREKKIPNKLNTRFRIGSMNKMFTATSILQLVQAGKIKLEDPLGKYLTDYPNKDVATKVTIHHLLTHTGGTGDIFTPEYQAHRLELKTLQDYEKLYGERGLKFEPGSKWEYSNYGFILLGLVIEKVSGQSYYDYVQEHVFKPAGMTGTGSEPEDVAVPDRSIGYTQMGSPAEWRPNTDTLPYRGTSAGGGYSTVEDLVKFATALLDHKLLNEHYTELLTTGKVETPAGDKYAYGFSDSIRDGVRSVGHNGGAPGQNGDLKIYPQLGRIVVALANQDPPAAGRVTGFVDLRLPEK